MSSNPKSRKLTVYLAGSGSLHWRVSLLNTQGQVAQYNDRVQQQQVWSPIEGCLPWGHTLIGPFYQRSGLQEAQELALQPGEGVMAGEYERKRDTFSPETERVTAIRRADIIFAWMEEEHGSLDACRHMVEQGLEIGLAVGMHKPLILATRDPKLLRTMPLATDAAWKIVSGHNAKEAFAFVMADMDINFRNGFTLGTSTGAACDGCGKYIDFGARALTHKLYGSFHKECFERAPTNSTETGDLLNRELLKVLREDNARLEMELRRAKGE